MKINEIINKCVFKLNENKIEDAKLKVRLLLQNILSVSKEYIIINSDNEFPNEKIEELSIGIDRLCNNEPIQYIVNNQNFYGENFYVDKNVLIPQPDTEILVEEVLKLAKKQGKNLKILDLCTGSGAIAVSLFKNLKNVEIIASDISKEALNVAKINIEKHECDIKLIESDLYENINCKFDIIVSNPPYIETNIIKELSKEVQNEPLLALDGKEDGLYFYREISKNAIKYLNDGGIIAFEIGYNQKESVEQILKENNFINVYSKKDLSGNDRIVIGYKN